METHFRGTKTRGRGRIVEYEASPKREKKRSEIFGEIGKAFEIVRAARTDSPDIAAIDPPSTRDRLIERRSWYVRRWSLAVPTCRFSTSGSETLRRRTALNLAVPISRKASFDLTPRGELPPYRPTVRSDRAPGADLRLFRSTVRNRGGRPTASHRAPIRRVAGTKIVSLKILRFVLVRTLRYK